MIHTNFLIMISIRLFYCYKKVLQYKYMDDWKKINEISLRFEKEDSDIHLNIESITNAHYTHAKRVCKNFTIINFGYFHDLYVQLDTLFLACVV